MWLNAKKRLQVLKEVKVRYRDVQAAAIAGLEAGRGPESIDGKHYLAADLEVVELHHKYKNPLGAPR